MSHPGAPRGNTNALTHGFYSRQFTRKESRLLDHPAMGCMQDEIILFKIIIDRISRRLRPGASTLSFQESVLTLHVVAQAISRLNSLYLTNRLLDATNDDGVITLLREHGFTEDQIRLETYDEGLDSASQLHVTHGFYASNFTPEEIDRVSHWTKKDLSDELPLLRILIKRTHAAILAHEKKHAGDTDADRSAQLDILHAYKILIYATSCLERLERSTGKLHRGERPPLGILGKALQEVHAELAAKKLSPDWNQPPEKPVPPNNPEPFPAIDPGKHITPHAQSP